MPSFNISLENFHKENFVYVFKCEDSLIFVALDSTYPLPTVDVAACPIPHAPAGVHVMLVYEPISSHKATGLNLNL